MYFYSFDYYTSQAWAKIIILTALTISEVIMRSAMQARSNISHATNASTLFVSI